MFASSHETTNDTSHIRSLVQKKLLNQTMAAKKKEEKASASEAADLVLRYIRVLLLPPNDQPKVAQCLHSAGKENRPYSAIEVSANLHNKVTKSKRDFLLFPQSAIDDIQQMPPRS